VVLVEYFGNILNLLDAMIVLSTAIGIFFAIKRWIISKTEGAIKIVGAYNIKLEARVDRINDKVNCLDKDMAILKERTRE